mmetsp:Transcript_19907/g.42472  ORF Transcript_19907/g.42472 Transcript_19907/m.42472 type:complete len:147 (+) Transcript_19907:88-528(+)
MNYYMQTSVCRDRRSDLSGDRDRTEGGVATSDCVTTLALQCLLGALLATGFMRLLRSQGFLPEVAVYCASTGYTWSAIFQDLRSLLAFVLGAVLWLHVERQGWVRREEEEDEEAEERNDSLEGLDASEDWGRKRGGLYACCFLWGL